MRRLGAIETTFRCPFTLAQRALCAVAILARAAALIVRRSRVTPVLFNPLSALIAVSRAFTCCAALSRSAFNCTSMSMCSSPGEDCSRYKQKLCGSLHQREQHSHSIWRSRALATVFRLLCSEPPATQSPNRTQNRGRFDQRPIRAGIPPPADQQIDAGCHLQRARISASDQ